ncbi:MAG TPA: GAF domain-containing protein [Kofleriaceae bacterium]|nr:GAF domain-containing protein [Kofleriaceae bacterium]
MSEPALFPDLQRWLESYLASHGGVAGTVHALAGDALELRAAVNIPPRVAEVTRTIPKGKGMAGLAWERDVPVSTCNLKTDQTGDVKPGARAVDAAAAVAIPIHAPGGDLRGVVGIAFAGERDMDQPELDQLSAEAEEAPL